MFAGLSQEEYYGPPAPGQSWSTYEAIMSMPIVAKIGVVGAVALVNPIVALGVGAVWLWNTGGSTAHTNKPTQQGG
jgi:hypothetical protein